ncbi:hypothetical protein IWW38_006560, partial [Coemansia aciculifera]
MSTVALPRPQSPSNAASDRCWICLEELDTNKNEWCYPCSCSLICHEECLLHWVTASEQHTRAGVIKCPQCNSPYQIVQLKSRTLKVLRTAYEVVDRAAPLALVAIGGISVLGACAVYGSYAVLTVYGPVDGGRILSMPGIVERVLRRLWLPMVPLALVWSRVHDSTAYMPLTILAIVPQPWRIQWPMSPWLALSALPSVSAIYRYIWDMTLGRLERHWETLVPPERPILSFEDFVVGHGMANIRVGFAVGNRDLPPDPPAVVHGNGQQPPLAGAQVGHDLPAGAL